MISPGELAGVAWHISTRSPDGGGQCVEAGPLADGGGRLVGRVVEVGDPGEDRAGVRRARDE
ncbi:DUF397 domain-containing protein [Streptosporangium sp. NBC_01469]